MLNVQQLTKETSDLCRYGRFAEATALLNRAHKESPRNFDVLLEKIRVALFQDQTDVAFQLIGEATKTNPQDPRLVALQGIWFLETKNYQGAAAALAWAAKAAPRDSNMALNLAIALRNLGDLQNAELQIIKSLSLNPLSELAHFEYSRILTLTDRMPEAMMQVLEAIKINPYFIVGYTVLERFFRSQNKVASAIKMYEIAIDIAPDVDFFYGQLAVLHELNGDYASALKYAQHLAQSNNSYYDHVRVGIYTFLIGQVAEAEVIFKKCIERDSSKWDAYYDLGELHLLQNQIDKARSDYQKAVERVGGLDSRPYNGLGVTHLLQGDDKNAEIFLDKALQINPNSFDASLNKALLFKTRKNKKLAKEWALKALALVQNNAKQKEKAEQFINDLNRQ